MRPHSLALIAAPLLALLAMQLQLSSAQPLSASFYTAAADLMATHQSQPGAMNVTNFDELYHTFLGGEPEHDEGVEPPLCPPADTVFAQHDLDGDALLNNTEFEEALVGMMVSKAIPCELLEEEPHEECHNSAKAAWGWSFLATIIICLLSLVGALLWAVTRAVPVLRIFLTNFMIAFAVGTLLGDAVLHIMPEMWGLHSHGGGHEEEAHGHGDGEEHHDKWEELEFLWPGLTLLGSLLCFAAVEYFISAFLGHSHGVDHTDHDLDHTSADGKSVPLESHKHSLPKSTGWLNLAAEVVHNFLDGIAIGVAFSNSNRLGVSTAIAVGAHELPQELGDFALLIEAGFSVPKALLLNLCASLSALLGVCVGVAAGTESEEAQKYLLAFAAGGFLYISLCSMVPSLHKLSHGKHRVWLHILQVLGFVTGVMVLFTISVTEPHDEC